MNTSRLFWMGLASLLVATPAVCNDYGLTIMVSLAIFALYAVSLNLILGYTGLLSFGHAMFFGSGTYATALALMHVKGLSLISAILIGGLFSMVLGLVLSPMLVRVSGTAFAMLTWALAQIMYIACSKFRAITGSEAGIAGLPRPALSIPGVASFDMAVAANFYYFAIAVVCLCLFGLWFFTQTPLGSIMAGIKDNDKRVDYLGVRVPHTKAIVFAVSGGSAGIAGALFAFQLNPVTIDSVLSPVMSVYPILMAMIGGVGSFCGPVYGAIVLGIVGDLVNGCTVHGELVMAIIYILAIIYAPRGIAGIPGTIRERWHRRREAKALSARGPR